MGCLIFADCTNEDSLTAALKWKEIVEENCDLIDGKTIPIVLMQNKCDKLEELGEKKPFQTIEFLNDFAKKNKFVSSYQVSVKSDINLKESMDTLLTAILTTSAIKKSEQDNFTAPKPNDSSVRSLKLNNGTQQNQQKKGASNSGGCC